MDTYSLEIKYFMVLIQVYSRFDSRVRIKILNPYLQNIIKSLLLPFSENEIYSLILLHVQYGVAIWDNVTNGLTYSEFVAGSALFSI